MSEIVSVGLQHSFITTDHYLTLMFLFIILREVCVL